MGDDSKQQDAFDPKRYGLRELGQEIGRRRLDYAAMEPDKLTMHRAKQPQKVVKMMDAAIESLERAAASYERGDGHLADEIWRRLSGELKAMVWHLALARLATQELDSRTEAAA